MRALASRQMSSRHSRPMAGMGLFAADPAQLPYGSFGIADEAALTALSPVGLFSADGEGRILQANQHCIRLLRIPGGRTVSDIDWWQAVHPQDVGRLRAEWRGAVTARLPYTGSFRVVVPEGTPECWLEVRVAPVDRPGQTAFAGAAVDVSETKRLEGVLERKNGLLQASQDRLTRALGASRLGMWEYDCAAGEVHFSPNWSELLGLPAQRQRMGTAQLAALIPEEDRERVRAAWRELLAGRLERMSVEHRVGLPGAEVAWLLTEAQVSERQEGGRALKIVGTSKNITERKSADGAIRVALQAAEQANRAKSDFLATMSHEIRTPLNGVIGLTELLAGAELPATEADAVAMIDSCAKSLLSVVDNILDFSKIEAGRLTLESIDTDVRRLVREVGDVFSVRSAEKGVRFELSVAANVPQWVVTDPARLRQVLLNLLGNALKFTRAGGFSLALGLQSAEAGEQLAFAVSDTGIGISEENQRQLFTRFTQVDSSNTRKYGGSGLGLAISRQLAQLMGGDVDLVSQSGVGSTFTLRIPLRVVEVAASATPVALRGPVRADAAILLAEDNPVNQLVARRLLGMLGYRNVTTVDNGLEALEACERQHFDLVLMDCQMPEMDGWTSTRRLRAQGHEMPILALTASAVAGDRERCLMVGMNDYLTKPIESALMAEKIDRWLSGSAARALEAD